MKITFQYFRNVCHQKYESTCLNQRSKLAQISVKCPMEGLQIQHSLFLQVSQVFSDFSGEMYPPSDSK